MIHSDVPQYGVSYRHLRENKTHRYTLLCVVELGLGIHNRQSAEGLLLEQ